MTGSIRVLVVDDAELIRVSLSMLVDATEGMAVVGGAADGRAAVEQALALRPDVVLMDIQMPVMDGVAATAEITAASDARVIALTTFDLPEHVYGVLRAGASGFLVKNAAPAELLRAIRVVAAGDALLSPSVTARIVGDIAAGAGLPATPLPTELTPRERDLLLQIAAGRNNDEIAEVLCLSPASVKTYVTRLLAKLGARDRVHLVIMAYESGLIAPGRPT